MEIILLAFGLVLIISVVQAVRRGEVDPETNEKNPTIAEQLERSASRLEKNAKILSERAKVWEEDSKFLIKHCGWFKDFECRIASTISHSQSRADFQLQLESDPDFKRAYEQQQAAAGKPIVHEPEKKASASWFSSGPPPEPREAKSSDYISREYRRHLENHISFVKATRKTLNENPRLKEIFVHSFQDGEEKERLLSHLFSAGTANSSTQHYKHSA